MSFRTNWWRYLDKLRFLIVWSTGVKINGSPKFKISRLRENCRNENKEYIMRGYLALITKMLYLQIWKDWWETIVGNFDFRYDIDTPKDRNQEHVVRLSQCLISIRNQLISCSSSIHPHREKLLYNLLLLLKTMIENALLFKFPEFIVTDSPSK